MRDASDEDLLKTLENQYFGSSIHESREVAVLPKLLKGVRVFVDVGASLGQYTYFANQVMHEGIIYPIEADPLRFGRLCELCEQWAKTGSNEIVPLGVAVSDEVGMATFLVTSDNKSGHLVEVENPDGDAPYEWKEVHVATKTLDSLFSRELEPDLVKMDVEGAEYRVLLGSAEILRRGTARFLVEVHPWGDPTIGKRESDVFDLFARFDYDFKRVHHHWLFSKSRSRWRLRIKNKLIHVILDHPFARRTVRKLFSAPR